MRTPPLPQTALWDREALCISISVSIRGVFLEMWVQEEEEEEKEQVE
jgi:hypothetical protein